MINSLKAKLREKTFTVGSWVTIPDPIIVEIMCQYFKWLVIDMEHSAIDLWQTQNLVRLIESKHVIPIVRISENNPVHIKRVMDTGAYGIIVPMVNTGEDAQNAIDSVYYPPYGFRGTGLARAQNYGFDFDEYKKKDFVVIAQIEHIDAIKNLKKILATDIDGLIIGPYDISASMGHPGNFSTKNYRKNIQRILDIAKNQKPVGIHQISPYGGKVCYDFLVFSIDTLLFGSKIRDELNGIKKI